MFYCVLLELIYIHSNKHPCPKEPSERREGQVVGVGEGAERDEEMTGETKKKHARARKMFSRKVLK